MKKSYLYKKNQLREKATALQVYENAICWSDLITEQSELEKDAKRYGLIKEFKKEGIL